MRESRSVQCWKLVSLLLVLALAHPSPAQQSEADLCEPVTVETRSVAGSRVERVLGDPATIEFESGMAIDADGALRAYHPGDDGLDRLVHAGTPGNWWALATDDATPGGTPLVQGEDDAAPGYHVSTTSLYDSSRAYADPSRYVDSEGVPYVALPAPFIEALGCRLGDLAWVERTSIDGTVHRSAAIFADVAPPAAPLGEGSIALAHRLGVPPDPRAGGTFRVSVKYVLFCGIGTPTWPRALADIEVEAARLERARLAREARSCPRR